MRRGLRSFTPTFLRKGQHLLFGPVFLPLSAHESRRLLALSFTPLAGYRSGLRSSFPAWPIGCSAFRPWSASIALPTARPTSPAADFRCRVQNESLHPQSRFRDLPRISRGKINRLPRTTAGSTTSAFDGYGLRYHWLARPATAGLLSGFCSSAREFVPRFLQTRPCDRRPCASLTVYLHQVR